MSSTVQTKKKKNNRSKKKVEEEEEEPERRCLCKKCYEIYDKYSELETHLNTHAETDKPDRSTLGPYKFNVIRNHFFDRLAVQQIRTYLSLPFAQSKTRAKKLNVESAISSSGPSKPESTRAGSLVRQTSPKPASSENETAIQTRSKTASSAKSPEPLSKRRRLATPRSSTGSPPGSDVHLTGAGFDIGNSHPNTLGLTQGDDNVTVNHRAPNTDGHNILLSEGQANLPFDWLPFLNPQTGSDIADPATSQQSSQNVQPEFLHDGQYHSFPPVQTPEYIWNSPGFGSDESNLDANSSSALFPPGPTQTTEDLDGPSNIESNSDD
jgi:hypothetical protein